MQSSVNHPSSGEHQNTVIQNMRIWGVPPCELPALDVEFGVGPLEALLDSGAVRSLMSGQVYRTLLRTCSLPQVFPVQVKCITAVSHSFPVHIAVKCKVKVDRYAWKFIFYVVEDLIHPVILGSDFLQNTSLLIDLYQGRAFFSFDSDNKLPMIGRTPPLDSPSICTSMQACPDLYICLSLHLAPFWKSLMNFPMF
jgi:hypothetical protein